MPELELSPEEQHPRADPGPRIPEHEDGEEHGHTPTFTSHRVAPLSGRGPSKVGELGACLLRHQRTGTQLHCEKQKRTSFRTTFWMKPGLQPWDRGSHCSCEDGIEAAAAAAKIYSCTNFVHQASSMVPYEKIAAAALQLRLKSENCTDTDTHGLLKDFLMYPQSKHQFSIWMVAHHL
ncbi:hypothetical protein QTO34_006997 [Cnephaeus nilssonii]|uniref:Uncharacterized protein n=1 Tax=Cnephaeus nilssonii TaxID=3371016 RepID=A0AA40LI08_CNENI|nr:hypothetical protein QTO34_006997 [Eptesicus nilssonii]